MATLIDCFNREVIGWSMADHLRTELVTDALDMAVANHRLEPDCILHSDRGTQYMSADYRTRLADLGFRHSVGRTGQCWDNALAESFFASLKNERVHHMVYPTRKKAKDDIARYIELFYLKISQLPEFIPDERRSGEWGFDSGGTVGAVAACRAVTPGSSVPGWLLLPWGRLDRGPRVRGWRGRG